VIQFDREALDGITPGAQPLYRQAFDRFILDLQDFDITDAPLRAEHFLAQTLHETGGLRILVENLNYSAPRLMQVWPSRFKTIEDARTVEHNPRALANRVYGGRMGNVEPEDGWRYIGRGLLQLTGRSSYARVGKALGLDLVGFPSLVLESENALKVAGSEWVASLCNVSADADDLERVTRKINGGLIGLAERREWLNKVRLHHVIREVA
jgi:putative chitinase